MTTTFLTAVGLEPFPTICEGDDLAAVIARTLTDRDAALREGDIVVIASRAVSVAEKRRVDLATIVPGAQARRIAETTGKPATLVQLILDESTEHHLATERGPIIARHRLGYQLASAGIDHEGTAARLLPADPDASARRIRDDLATATGIRPAVVIADSEGRPDRRGATILAIGAAGIRPLRTTTHTAPEGTTKHQEETLTDLVAACGGIILGQRGRGVPVAIIRGVAYEPGDDGVQSILHR